MKKLLILAAPIALFLGACSNSSTSTDQAAVDSLTSAPDTLSAETKELVDFKLFYTIANLPSPIELINDVYNSDVPFNSELLNSTDNETKYNTSMKKAANYGVYGIDMAYAAFYGQNQDLINSYLTTKKMAERLNISETFEKFTADFENSQSSKDSLVKIIDRAYTETDAYLRKNNRYVAAAQALAGAVVEVEYLSVELMKKEKRSDKNKVVFEKIYNQRLYIDNLIGLFETLKSDKECASLLSELQLQRKALDEIKTADDLTPAAMEKLAVAVGRTRDFITR
ncbi:MAG: hypothetical protein ACKO1U_09055 [Bacteroidota bacterium]